MKRDDLLSYDRNGYLSEDFRIFHLNSPIPKEIALHYHDFHKLFLFLGGDVSYQVEERRYDLALYDCLLIPAGTLHRPIVKIGEPYERLIIYIRKDFLSQEGKASVLAPLFFEDTLRVSHRIRIPSYSSSPLFPVLSKLLEDVSQPQDTFGNTLLMQTHITEYLLYLSRAILKEDASYSPSESTHPIVKAATELINAHISEELSVDRIAQSLYLSRSYLMHVFKEQTGSTLTQYITEKRLFLTSEKIKRGLSISEASMQSGFPSYSSYYYAKKNSVTRKNPSE